MSIVFSSIFPPTLKWCAATEQVCSVPCPFQLLSTTFAWSVTDFLSGIMTFDAPISVVLPAADLVRTPMLLQLLAGRVAWAP